MATLTFPPLIFGSAAVKKLLTDKSTKNFYRLCIQFFRNESDDFTLVAHVVGRARKSMDVPLIFLKPYSKNEKEYKEYKVMNLASEIILGQFELSRKQVEELSDNGKVDMIFKPDKIKINPEAVIYDVNGWQLNPCPPADPPTN